VATHQEDHPSQAILGDFFDDVIRETEVAELTVRSAKDPARGDKSNEDSDCKGDENQEETEMILSALRMSKNEFVIAHESTEAVFRSKQTPNHVATLAE
jgi:hypothetical protein